MMTGPEELVASVLDLRICERGREQTCDKRPRSTALHWLLLTWDTSAYYNHHIRIYVYDLSGEKRKDPWNRSLQVAMLLPSWCTRISQV